MPTSLRNLMGSTSAWSRASATAAHRPIIPLDVRPRVWYNEDLSSRNYLIPGLIAVIMMVISAMLTSLTVAREWERGTMEQLISTPVKLLEVIVGKLVPYFIVGAVGVLMAVAMGAFMFHVPLRGNVALLLGTSAAVPGRIACHGHPHQHRHEEPVAGQPIGRRGHLPARKFLLSGFIHNIANMPQAIHVGNLPCAGALFRDHSEGDLHEGSGCRNARRPDCIAGDFRGRSTPGGSLDISQEARIAMFERIKHMLVKEFIQVFRDPRMLIVIFLVPCVQVLVIGYAVTFDVKHVRTAVYDLDNSQVSRELTSRFVGSGYFDVVATVGDDQSTATCSIVATLPYWCVSTTGSPKSCAAAGRP